MLHTVNKSPFERTSLQSCLRVAADGSSVLLIEDGVYAAMSDTESANLVAQATKRLSIYALGPDLKARGIDETRLAAGIQLVDYGGFVDLAAEHDTVQAWL